MQVLYTLQTTSVCVSFSVESTMVYPMISLASLTKTIYQRGSPCKDPAGNWTTQRPPDHPKRPKLQWYGHVCLRFIKSDQHHLANHSVWGKKTRQTEEVGRRPQGMDRPEVRKVPEHSGEQRKMEETGCEIICGAPTTLTVEG